MEKIEINSLETEDQIKGVITAVVRTYNQLNEMPNYFEFISPIIDYYINNSNITTEQAEQINAEINKFENNFKNNLKQLYFEFDILIGYFASNYFLSLKQQNEIVISEEEKELIIKFNFNKFVEKFSSLDQRLFVNIKNQLIDVIKIENSIIEEVENLFQQYEKFIKSYRDTKVHPENGGSYIKKPTSYKTLLFDQ